MAQNDGKTPAKQKIQGRLLKNSMQHFDTKRRTIQEATRTKGTNFSIKLIYGIKEARGKEKIRQNRQIEEEKFVKSEAKHATMSF